MLSIFKHLFGKLLPVSFLLLVLSYFFAKFLSPKSKKSTTKHGIGPTSANSSGLEGKVVIVTGASGGVGLATTNALLSAGCKVFALDIVPFPSGSPPNSTTENFAFLKINLTEERAPEQIADLCTYVFGRIDALLNIAGVVDKLASVENVMDDDWDKIIAVNLTAPIRLMRSVVKVMKDQGGGGVIVNVASKAGTSGAVAGVAYTASKHGLVGATKNTAFLMKSDGIRCNAICPGMIATSMSAPPDFSKFDMSSLMKIRPVSALVTDPQTGHGMIDPSAFTSKILFLLSDGAEAINGAIIPIDNAWSTL